MSLLQLSFEAPDGPQLFSSASPCVIGRSSGCTVRLHSPDVSRRHAVILNEGREWWLADCGSRGGTWLNGIRIESSQRLASGDFIGIGLTSLRFQIPESPMATSIHERHLMETTKPGDSEWLVTSDAAVVWVSDSGEAINCSPAAERWLKIFFNSCGNELPSCLLAWLEEAKHSNWPFERKVGDERLRIHACLSDQSGRLLVFRRLKPAFGPDSLKSFGLSQAESILVPWLVRGKRNEEIAMIVGLSPKTVEKQVASILCKLKVETRTAAAWTIIEQSGAHW